MAAGVAGSMRETGSTLSEPVRSVPAVVWAQPGPEWQPLSDHDMVMVNAVHEPVTGLRGDSDEQSRGETPCPVGRGAAVSGHNTRPHSDEGPPGM